METIIDFNSIIDKWVREYTVLSETTPSKSTLKTFARPDRTPEKVDEFMHCEFIAYNYEHRIVIDNPYFIHDFYHCLWDNSKCGICFHSNIHRLTDAIINPEYDPGETIAGDTYYVDIERVHEIIKFFNLTDFNFEESEHIREDDYRVEEGRFMYSGDQWEYDAEHFYKESELYNKVEDAIAEYLQFEFAPYRKYNPGFDYFKNNEPLNSNEYDKIFELLTKDQVIQALTANCYEGQSLCSMRKCNVDEVKNFINALNDMSLVKGYIKALFADTETFARTAIRMFNL